MGIESRQPDGSDVGPSEERRAQAGAGSRESGAHPDAGTAHAGGPSGARVRAHPSALGSTEYWVQELELALLEGQVRASLEHCTATAQALGELDARIEANAARLAQARSPLLCLLRPWRQCRRRRRFERRHAELVAGRRHLAPVVRERAYRHWLQAFVSTCAMLPERRWVARTGEVRGLAYQLLEILAMQQALDDAAFARRVRAGQGVGSSPEAVAHARDLLSCYLEGIDGTGGSAREAARRSAVRAFLLDEYCARSGGGGPEVALRRCA